MAAVTAVPGSRESTVDLQFATDDGVVRPEPLAQCSHLPFEFASPARMFASYRGQRNFPGIERLATSMLIRRVDISRRIDRYGALLEAIQAGSDLNAPSSPLQLTPEEKVTTLERLAADIYAVTRTRLYILLRLDSALSAGGATYNHPLITVEHVLPQPPRRQHVA